jgi:hypothetical protein
VTAGQDYDNADAGLVAPPTVDGEAFAAMRGLEYSGAVASIEGTAWGTGDLAALIQWGDGAETDGTLAFAGTALEVFGQHTYAHEGAYALAVRVDVTAVPSAVNYAAGLVYVLAPTDHRNLEKLDGDSVSGSINLGRDATLTTAGYVGQADASLSFSFGESIDEPDDSYSRGGVGSIDFSLYESGSDFSQPDSSITLSDSEWATRYETDGAPLKVGTAAVLDSTDFTLIESGAAAVYSWTASGETTVARSEDETVPDGTYTATDNKSFATIANGVTDCSGATFTETWSGTPTTSRVEIGYHGPESYTLVHSESSGTVAGSESGGYGSYSFSRTETHLGTETAIETETDPGGGSSETRIENHTDTLSASGNDFGDISVSTGRGSSYSLLGGDTLYGVVTNGTGGGTDSDSATTTGSQVTGGFTLVHGASEGGVETATTNNQGVFSTETTTSTDSDSATEYGTAGSGGYSFIDVSGDTSGTTGIEIDQSVTTTWSNSDTDSSTATRTGDRISGAYSLFETDSSTSSSTGTSKNKA